MKCSNIISLAHCAVAYLRNVLIIIHQEVVKNYRDPEETSKENKSACLLENTSQCTQYDLFLRKHSLDLAVQMLCQSKPYLNH